MGRFTSGLIAGGVMGAIGLAVAMSDKRTRKRMLKDGKKAMNKANSFIHHI
ncbi:MAG: YtxH domain-containing protein [Defluviitaleaceae bacterium]|nr:YtxH domain-containing protein [Defluviitaleaceae bacterium]